MSTLMGSHHASQSDSNVLNRPRLGRMTRLSRASGMRYHHATTICGRSSVQIPLNAVVSPNRMARKPLIRAPTSPVAMPSEMLSDTATARGAAEAVGTAKVTGVGIPAFSRQLDPRGQDSPGGKLKLCFLAPVCRMAPSGHRPEAAAGSAPCLGFRQAGANNDARLLVTASRGLSGWRPACAPPASAQHDDPKPDEPHDEAEPVQEQGGLEGRDHREDAGDSEHDAKEAQCPG